MNDYKNKQLENIKKLKDKNNKIYIRQNGNKVHSGMDVWVGVNKFPTYMINAGIKDITLEATSEKCTLTINFIYDYIKPLVISNEPRLDLVADFRDFTLISNGCVGGNRLYFNDKEIKSTAEIKAAFGDSETISELEVIFC